MGSGDGSKIENGSPPQDSNNTGTMPPNNSEESMDHAQGKAPFTQDA